MAKAAPKLSTLLIGEEVTLNLNLCDISGDAHPAAGQRATVIVRNSKTAYQIETQAGQVYVVHESDWTPYPNKLHPDTLVLAEHRKTINLYLDSKLNQVQQLLPATIHPSPFNPRTNYPADEMAELAESAKEVGILQPVLVRPRGDGSYELVFGHRRHRAALQAGLSIMPAIVRDLTDAQSAQLQAVENVQRRDLDPIDEALGYAAFIAAHGITKDELARQIGKSRTHVYNRLKLATLHPDGQAALRAGKIRAEVATHVARVQGAKNQAKALALMLESGHGGELKSLRTAKHELSERFTLDLKTALWALEDAELVPSAGACTVCPKRSGVDQILFADLLEKPTNHWSNAPKGQNVCTDPDCFADKKSAQLKRNQDALEAKGKVMVVGNAARRAVDAQGKVKGDYIPVSEMRDALKNANNGTDGPAVTILTIQDQRSGKTIEVVKRKEAEAAGVKTPAAKPINSRMGWNAYELDRKEDEKARDAKAAAQTRLNVAALHKVRVAAANVRESIFELRLIAQVALAGVAYIDRETLLALYGVADIDELTDTASRMSPTGLTTLLLDCALVKNVRRLSYGKPEAPLQLLAAAAQYGVDLEAVRSAYPTETAEAEAEASTS